MSAARILVIDDSTADVSLLRVALNQQNEAYQLEVFETADEALAFVQECKDRLHEEEPCVILLDLHLPRYDGITILEAIKQAPVLAHIHVMLLSGIATPQEQFKIAALGVCRDEKSDADLLRSEMSIGGDVASQFTLARWRKRLSTDCVLRF